MAISEANRLAMHLGLRRVLGDEQADILMEHLPPGGWADVARKDDIDRISIEIDRRSSEIDRRFSDMDRRLSRMTAAFLSIGLAIFAIQVEILLNL
jgi:hypothetical protein